MSGTSLDAIDAALVEIEREDDTLFMRLLAFTMQPLDNELRFVLRSILPPNDGTTKAVSHLNFTTAEAFAQAAEGVARKANLPLSEVDVIASHGQTVWHQPHGTRSTLQIGNGAVIAERTGCTVINDFRPRDIAAGGQGAPLVPYFDALFWRHPAKNRVLLNIGGIANLTFVPPHGDILAFDTGPGNVLMNEAMSIFTHGQKSFDEDGQLARGGVVNEGLLKSWIQQPYFKKQPPKSTGREMFGPQFAKMCVDQGQRQNISNADIMATLVRLTVSTIGRGIHDWLPQVHEIYIGGGGANNPVLMEMLRSKFGNRLYVTDDSGLPADAKEAVAFAVLGYAALHGYPANVPSATGATGAAHPVVLGSITPGDNYRNLLANVAQSPAQAPSRLMLK